MNTQHGTNRMAVPPPVADRRPTPSLRTTAMPSPTMFVGRVVLSAIAIVMAGTLLLVAPDVVRMPMLFVLAIGFLVSCALVSGDGWLARRLVPTGDQRPTPTRRHTDRAAPPPAAERRSGGRRGATEWEVLAAVAVASLMLLLFAIVASEGVALILVATGLLGLVGLRVSAAYGRWGPG